MNTKITIHRRSPRPIIKIIKYCPQLTISQLFASHLRQSPPQLNRSKIYSSFVVPQTSVNQMRRYISIDKFQPVTHQLIKSASPQPIIKSPVHQQHLIASASPWQITHSGSPKQLLTSASPTERKLSLLSHQRTTVGQESAIKEKGSVYQIEYDDDTMYYGEIKITNRNGLGALYNKKKELIYQGQWKDDKYHGFGVLHRNGKTYKGEFVNGTLNGEGIEESDDSKFYGYFQNGKKNGPGTLYVDKKPIQGMWKNDKMELEC